MNRFYYNSHQRFKAFADYKFVFISKSPYFASRPALQTLSYQPELLHFPYMGLFPPVRPDTIMNTFRMLNQIAAPMPEIALNLLRYVLALDPGHKVTYPD